jgi:hypothetical protein
MRAPVRRDPTLLTARAPDYRMGEKAVGIKSLFSIVRINGCIFAT